MFRDAIPRKASNDLIALNNLDFRGHEMRRDDPKGATK